MHQLLQTNYHIIIIYNIFFITAPNLFKNVKKQNRLKMNKTKTSIVNGSQLAKMKKSIPDMSLP